MGLFTRVLPADVAPLICERSPVGCLDAAAAAASSDDKAALPQQQVGYVYVDNLGVLGTPAAAVDRAISALVGAFDAAGLQTHERDITTESATALGVLLDLQTLSARIIPSRLFRLSRALRWALSRRRLPGRSWEVLVGHMML